MTHLRLNKYLASKGYASRRGADALIEDGKVLVNGKKAETGMQVDPKRDNIEVVGELQAPSKQNEKLVYIALNKPVDYITSASSEQGQSVMDLLTPDKQIGKKKEPLNARVYPVGRLDKDSEGLVLLTNDGDLANQLTHPRYEHEKEYEVMIDKQLSPASRKILTKGMRLDDEVVGGIEIVKEWNQGKRTIVTVILKEGKNRQIRRMFGALGYHVISLKRTRIGQLTLGTIPPGRWKYVRKNNIV